MRITTAGIKYVAYGIDKGLMQMVPGNQGIWGMGWEWGKRTFSK